MPLFGPNIGKMAANGDIRGLSKVVQDGRAEERARAIEALASTRQLDALEQGIQTISKAPLPVLWDRAVCAVLTLPREEAQQVLLSSLVGDTEEGMVEKLLDALVSDHRLQSTEVWRHAGEMLLAKGRTHLALRCFDEAVAIGVATKELLGSIGATLIDAHVWDAALRFFGKYSEVDPDDERGWGGQGFCLQNLGRLAEAKAACQKSIQLQPSYGFARNTLCGIYAESGENEALERLAREAVELDPSNIKARGLLSEALMLTNRLAEAQEQAQAMLSTTLAADHATPEALVLAYSQLGTIAVMRGHDSALEYFEKAIKADQRDPWGYNLADACVILSMTGSLSQGTPQQRRARLLGFAQQRAVRYSSYAEWKARSGT